jgi:acyl-CoA synthetase (AMP-forming)/AMP-acid ligase II
MFQQAGAEPGTFAGPSSIYALVSETASLTPDAPAIASPGRRPLAYRELLHGVNHCGSVLNGLGIENGDRVAVVLPNGPEMAVAFLGIAAIAACAPLNPAFRESEFAYALESLAVRALVLPAGSDSLARAAAQRLGIRLIELTPDAEAEAGRFTLTGAPAGQARHAGPDDVALVLHTSGTTARPKAVPLTQRNLCASAVHIRESLALTPADRCLNVMPLFHIHGLVGVLLSSLAAGACIACAPGYYAPNFFDWVDEIAPTWYSAVPTMHQSILAQAAGNREIIARRPLRFIRSCSSALPPSVMAELEQVFGVPVIEAYGMTEAAHQIASNPLPPAPRKPGSVGLPAGPEVAIMDEAGRLLPAGEQGEVVIRGINVTPGYEDNADANRSAFTDGWFRTGDQGRRDGDGYIFLTGRIKELINRGGEKISPREIDEALLEHPAVAEALAFAMPHPKLGEEVAAAVVPREPGSITERELRMFLAGRLSDFKVPRRIVFLEEIPRGATGKLQRVGLAERLGVHAETIEQAEYVPPGTPEEATLAALWTEVLKVAQVGIHDHFLQLGGDSVLATLLLSRMREEFQVAVSQADFFEAPTVAEQALLVTQRKAEQEEEEMALILAELDAMSDDEAQQLLDGETLR